MANKQKQTIMNLDEYLLDRRTRLIAFITFTICAIISLPSIIYFNTFNLSFIGSLFICLGFTIILLVVVVTLLYLFLLRKFRITEKIRKKHITHYEEYVKEQQIKKHKREKSPLEKVLLSVYHRSKKNHKRSD